MTTFLFYQTLAYMGESAGDWLAAAERGGPERARALLGMGELLGGIEVAVAGPDGAWRTVGSFDEAGPIAGDTQVIPLPVRHRAGPLRVRLRMAKGHWRLDRVALGELGAPVEALALPPVAVERGGRPDPAALTAVLGHGRRLVTLPGDTAIVRAPRARIKGFPEAGVLLQWMRAEWMREEDPAMVSSSSSGGGPRRLAAVQGAGGPRRRRSGAAGSGSDGDRGKPVVSAVLVLTLSACATTTPRLPVGGRPVELERSGGLKGSPLKGELLAVGPERLWILGRDGVRGVPFTEVEQARVRLHGLDGRKSGLWAIVGGIVSGTALTLACASVEGDGNCGAMLGVAAVAWGLIGGPSAVSLGRSSQLRVNGPDFEPLRPARTPRAFLRPDRDSRPQRAARRPQDHSV
jgi:hypothetical protein